MSPPPFDVCGPLPSGVTVLEASAGTGKTFTIAALAARYVAEGTPLERMLLMTFGRMATGELRARVRERLVSAEAGLAAALVGVPPPPADDVLRLLAGVPADEVAVRRDRLARALAEFDAATITTTHGFCQHVLHGLGLAGDVEPDVRFVEDVSDLVEEVVHDLYLRRFAATTPPDGLDLGTARRIGRAAVEQPAAVIEPAAAPVDSVAAMRARLAGAVRDEVARRKRLLRIMTYDDLLTRLDATLRDPARGPAALARLRDRYRLAMVDEFQDTDPVQWDIVRTAFGGGASTLVLIGDPKQAIYTFRGADVHTYLAAAASADTTATLGRNWRSDQALVDALDAVLDGTTLGHPGIQYRRVRATEANQRRRLLGAPSDAALRMRIVHRADGRVDETAAGWATNASARRAVAVDLAADAVELLTSGATTLGHDATGTATERAIGPGDIAVLVGTHRQGALVRDALDEVGVPAVINGAGSVFATTIAKEWLALLEALERPSSVTRVRSAALTTFLGWSAGRVALAEDAAWEDVYVRLHDWAGVLRANGVASLLEAITRAERLTTRVLSSVDGERRLTDIRHIGQLLHHEATSERLGVAALTTWLRERVRDAPDDVNSEDRSRRLDSDAAAVQVLTIHRCKGLQFPVVYCPFLWQPPWIPPEELPVFHDPAAGDRRTIDVGGRTHAGFAGHQALHVAERHGEALRLAYVAMTRAQHQVVLHWASSWDSRESPLARLLFAHRLTPGALGLTVAPDEEDVMARLSEVAGVAPGTVAVERAGGGRDERWTAAGTSDDLTVRPFDRALDTMWRRASYSSLTASAREPGRAPGVTSEPEDIGTTDEDVGPVPDPSPDGPMDERARLDAVALPLAVMAGGARVGTVIHGVLEHTDFTAPDLSAALHTALAAESSWSPVAAGPTDAVVEGLALAIDTPLGAITGDRRLRDFGRADRLDELTFELPLAGGDTPRATVGVADIAALLDRHLSPDDPLSGYPDHLRDPGLDQQLRGYLTGSIDAVLRVSGSGAGPRFAVVDYKTNWLARDGEDTVTAWHYRPAALAVAMQHAHYPLQALLYCVALHRFLRWRLPGYDPEQQLAGVLYLFVRGMVGSATPTVGGERCGVFSWRPPAALVVATSELLDRGTGRHG